MLKEKKQFSQSGMNLDTDARSLPPNHYGFALNVLTNNSNGSNLGCVENRKGNVLVNFDLPSGTNKVVGACKDIQREAIVYFVYNSNKDHCILRYNIKIKTIDKILYGIPQLNFQPDIIISSINIIGDLLYWTDGYFSKFTYTVGEMVDSGFNPPRKINMVKAYNYTNNIAVTDLYKYTAIDNQVLDRIKYPPTKRPIIKYYTDTEKNFNYLTGNLFQFAYAYVYDDNEVSVLSPISEVLYPANEENLNGNPSITLPKLNNGIALRFNTGHEIVRQIKLYVRKLNNGDWFLFNTIDKYDNSGHLILSNNILIGLPQENNSVVFYNNEVLIPVDQFSITRPFDYVGQIVEQSTIISNNRIVDGGITENYDNTNIDVSLTESKYAVNFGATAQTIAGNSNIAGGDLEMVYYDFNANALQIYVGYQIQLVFTIYDANIGTNAVLGTYSYSTTILPTDTFPQDTFGRLINMIEADIPGSDVNLVPLALGDWSITIGLVGVFPGWNFATDIFMYVIGNRTPIPTFKEGFSHYFGLAYFDRAGRSGAVNVSKDTVKYVDFITETSLASQVSGDRYATNFNWEVNHKPPEWATQYQWYYARQTPNFVQYYYTVAQVDGNGNITLDVNNSIALLKAKNPNLNIPAYVFSKGDRVRFIATGKYATPTSWWYFDNFIDTEIIDANPGVGQIVISDVGFSSNRIAIPSGWDYSIIEIYTPRKIDDESSYFAIGERLDILNPHTENRAHAGSNGINQTYVTSYTDYPLLHIDIHAKFDINGNQIPGVYFVTFIIGSIDPLNPFDVFLNNIFPQGSSIEIVGLTDSNSMFLNGTHILSYDATGDATTIHLLTNTLVNIPSLTNIEYNNYYAITNGKLRITTLPSPAKGIFYGGDVFIKNRFAIQATIPVESDSSSDYYESNAISIGASSAVVADMKRQKYTKLRHSKQLLEDTRINNLSRFDWSDQVEVGNEYGDITSIKQVGDALKVLQKNKNTSYYIGIQQLSTANGSDIPVQSSGVVFSRPNISSLGYGCQHPASVLVNDRYMYFYDQNYGVFVRDAANGMLVISDAGMKSFFSRKRQEINDSYKHKVITSFNKKFNEVVVTFITYNLVPIPEDISTYRDDVLIETVCFCENSDTWVTFLSYSKTIDKNEIPIDYMAYNGETFVTFLNGQLYLENEGVFGNFFGENKDMVVDVISNIEQEKVKIFSAIGLTTNHNKTSLPDSWYVDSIIVPTTDVNASGQLSEIASGRFRMKEEALYADVPRDINSPISGTTAFKLINGRVMRGQCATFRLKNNSNDAVILYSVIFKT